MDEKKVKPMSLGTASSMTFAVLVIPPVGAIFQKQSRTHQKRTFGLRTSDVLVIFNCADAYGNGNIIL